MCMEVTVEKFCFDFYEGCYPLVIRVVEVVYTAHFGAGKLVGMSPDLSLLGHSFLSI